MRSLLKAIYPMVIIVLVSLNRSQVEGEEDLSMPMVPFR